MANDGDGLRRNRTQEVAGSSPANSIKTPAYAPGGFVVCWVRATPAHDQDPVKAVAADGIEHVLGSTSRITAATGRIERSARHLHARATATPCQLPLARSPSSARPPRRTHPRIRPSSNDGWIYAPHRLWAGRRAERGGPFPTTRPTFRYARARAGSRWLFEKWLADAPVAVSRWPFLAVLAGVAGAVWSVRDLQVSCFL
jgi:hypothetical protein